MTSYKDNVEAFAWSIVYTLSFSPDEIKTPEKKKAKEYMAKYSSKEIPGSKEYLKELENQED